VALAPKGFIREGADFFYCCARLARIERTGCQIPNAPALETAATILGTLIQLMPDKIMGILDAEKFL